RLAGLVEPADELHRLRVAAQLVGIADAARDQERVVVGGRHLLDRTVDRQLARRVEVVEALDLTVVDRDDLDVGAGILARLPRLLQLDPLEHVGSEDRDLLASQHLSHFDPSRLLAPARRLPGAPRPMRPDRCGGDSRGTAVRKVTSRSRAAPSPAARTSGPARARARRATRAAARTRRARPARRAPEDRGAPPP